MSAENDLPDHLDVHLQDWVAQELITASEADRIATFEASHLTVRRIPAAAEIVGYLGAVLVLAAGSVVYGRSFSDISHGVRVAIPAVITALMLGAGIPLFRHAEAMFRRLGAMLWTLSVAVFALTLAIAL